MPEGLSPERAMKLLCYQEAEKLWATFTDSEKRGASFGMFPRLKMQPSLDAGHDSRLLSLALMDLAAGEKG